MHAGITKLQMGWLGPYGADGGQQSCSERNPGVTPRKKPYPFSRVRL